MKKKSNAAVGKLAALKGLRNMASDMMGGDLAGLKKVTVAAKDKMGLKQGLDKAKMLVDDNDEDDMKD